MSAEEAVKMVRQLVESAHHVTSKGLSGAGYVSLEPLYSAAAQVVRALPVLDGLVERENGLRAEVASLRATATELLDEGNALRDWLLDAEGLLTIERSRTARLREKLEEAEKRWGGCRRALDRIRASFNIEDALRIANTTIGPEPPVSALQSRADALAEAVDELLLRKGAAHSLPTTLMPFGVGYMVMGDVIEHVYKALSAYRTPGHSAPDSPGE